MASSSKKPPDAPVDVRRGSGRIRRASVVAVIATPVVLLGCAFLIVPWVYQRDLSTPFAHRRAAWTTAERCRACHPDHYRSWYRTFHRTMTREARPASVLGQFDGRVLRYEGVAVRPVREGDEFFMEYLDGAGRVQKRLPIVRTVGSRRYQQYLTRGTEAGNYFRVPLLWHVEQERWLHLNGAFLDQDGQPFDQHLATWNQNCIFCHNTGPRPGLLNREEFLARQRRGQADAAFDLRFESQVAELGISCATCHAPGGEHIRRNRDPLRRYLLYLTGRDDPTIVNPADLPHTRSAEICGQCHAQRLPLHDTWIWDWLDSGPTYRAGEPLRAHVRPIWRDTRPLEESDPELFSLRFWADGTPRLTAYEYQGLLQSPCHVRGELTCISCHSMHGGDVRGMLPERMRTAAACGGGACHADIVADAAGHSHHAPGSSGTNCYDCHMPRMVYGILDIHRSHRIEIPDAARDAANARPNACGSCHVDRSLVWVATAMREWWGDDYEVPVVRADGAPVDVPDAVAAMLAGDPVQRAVAARLAGRDDAPLAIGAHAYLIPHLLLTLDNDYPTVRWLARQSLLALRERLIAAGAGETLFAGLAGFDHLAPAEIRAAALDEMWDQWRAVPRELLAPPPPDALLDDNLMPLAERTHALIKLQIGKNINIGE